MPPEALGIEPMRAGLEAGTRYHPSLLPFAVCSLLQRVLAQTIKILAHDNKPGAGCLLNLDCRFQPAGFRLRDLRCGISCVSRLLCGGIGAEPRSLSDMAIFQDITMCTKSGQASDRLRITQAYIALSGIPGSNPTPGMVSIVRIGEHEVRMFSGLPVSSGDASLLWMELFDHEAKMSIDSCGFREIDEAVSAFDVLVAQVRKPDEVPSLRLTTRV